jgi:prepilin-type N-terminal cleavage/methylation domain-containing protein
MATSERPRRQGGFTMVEVTVSLVMGAILLTAVYQLWLANHNTSARLGSKTDFRDRATLATTRLNRSITMAGFGMTKMDVLFRIRKEATDTLVVYSNPTERRTTLRDTAFIGATSILVFTDTGFAAGGLIGITDSLQQEYATITGITGDLSTGFRLGLSTSLQHKYLAGIPDIYPVQKEKFFINSGTNALVRKVDGAVSVLSAGITDFRADLKDASGNDATSYRAIRVVTFAMTGTYKAPQGSSNTMRFSSTVIPRNIL